MSRKKYIESVDDKRIHTAAYLAAYGHSNGFIARALGTSPSSLSNLKKKYPEFREALATSQDSLIQDVKANMFRIATEGKDSDAVNAGFKLLEKYDMTHFVDVEIVDDADLKDAILLELQVV